ncbi:serpin B11-like [Vombatus ursinus]|uniref:Serpin B7 n=1 Tax=Vombatus ursinus TaxID=29139 RepID=A0A4X2L722_VOMUR|nr:serpin B11-like [Vombatus ursinus]XP_027724837.1 serpin B11-like [Vombatus ursinus]XP_027724838.1 serpin B11-like [Vombatus ursinus]XP_027724839.1 serpin B11-like [Vombatus ursinus]XP_027724840.1 serpin B11-like [Vombatus ursinus]XP_027724841.1 serpin B11-like [Vombatus ursinus]
MDFLSTANVEFCLDVFKELSRHNVEDNVFFSPMSLFYALSMLLLGARGNSAAQMGQVLHFGYMKGSSNPELGKSSKCGITGGIHSEFPALFSRISQSDSNYTLSIANKLYGTKNIEFHPQYLSCSEKFYQSKLQTVDFQHAPEETRKTINAWVESKTNGKIKNLFIKGTIDTSSVMVLVNAIYFKGQWQSKFQEEETIKMPFKLRKGRTVPVQMMHQIGTFKVALIKEPQMQVLELPYASGDLSMIILLPKHTEQVEQIEKQLNLKTFKEWTNSFMIEKEVEVLLPRFKLGIKYELNSLLKTLGMTDVFDHSKADLSGLSPSSNLYLSKVVHESFVDVNEEGTEASAATGDVIVVKRLPVRIMFVADHPFLFFIKHISTNTILFCGRFSSP